MKKYLAILFTFFYFGFSSGMVYNVHYCLDKIFLSASSSSSCDICGNNDKKDCCKSENKVLKTDIAQKTDISVVADAPAVALLSQVYYPPMFVSIAERNQYSVNSNAPPDQSEIPFRIRYCNFRI